MSTANSLYLRQGGHLVPLVRSLVGMKQLLLVGALGVVGLGKQFAASPAHKAVSNYLRNTLDVPDSYQPISWSGEKAYTKQDADHALGKKELKLVAFVTDLAYTYQSRSENPPPSTTKEEWEYFRSEANRYSHIGDSVSVIAHKLQESTDTTKLGVILTHTYRARNKAAVIALTSARFIILKTGEVTVLQEHE